MRDCTNCKWDAKTSNCVQGHWRTWHHSMVSLEGERVPISDCHAWKERECDCKDVKWSSGMIKLFNVSCKKCGRVMEDKLTDMWPMWPGKVG